jgi:hypothetical protein
MPLLHSMSIDALVDFPLLPHMPEGFASHSADDFFFF